MRYLILFIYSLTALLPLAAQSSGKFGVQCPAVKVKAERLADMNLPRLGHTVLLLNGEPTVIGGHTTNFVPTPTLEYYKDGQWHLVPTAFTHDDGCTVELTTGKVLIVGGHEKNLGVGQSFEAELYDPATHTSEGFASLYTRRAKASALALDDGSAVIAGNWYHKDAIEIYDGKENFMPVKEVSIGRSTPHILRTAKDDAIIIGGSDTVGRQITLPVADRLRGEPYHVPLLETWQLFRGDKYWPSSHYFIGDETKGDYSYLLPITNDEGQMAIARVTNGDFSLLDTDVPIPKSFTWGKIHYCISFLADRQRQRAYLIGADSTLVTPCDTTRVFVIAIDYAHTPARLTFCYTDVLTDVDIAAPLLNDDGDLMLIGGVPKSSFFKPTAATWLIHLNPRSQAASFGHHSLRLPLWVWGVLLMALALAALWLVMRARRKGNDDSHETTALPASTPADGSTADSPLEENDNQPIADHQDDTHLIIRICQAIEENKLFLNPNLKVTVIASILGSNRTTVSNCINNQRGCSFPQLVNAYRVAYAQNLMRNQPDIKIADVWMAAGFSSEASFYRIFKTVAGITPKEWKSDQVSSPPTPQ